MAETKEKALSLELVATPAIEKRIFIIRERQVMLDEDLAGREHRDHADIR